MTEDNLNIKQKSCSVINNQRTKWQHLKYSSKKYFNLKSIVLNIDFGEYLN